MKVSLLRMVLAQEQEVDRIDTWESVLKAEGKMLDKSMEERRWIARRTQQTLELLLKHEDEFRRMLAAHAEAVARARSTGPSSDQSMSESSPSAESTALSSARTMP